MLLVVNSVLNSIDILMFFLLSHACVKRIPIFTVKRVLIGLVYGVAMGAVAYLFVDIYIYRLIAMPVALFMIYSVVKLPFSSTFLVFILVLLFQAIQFPLVIILELIQIEVMPMFLIGQILTLVTVVLICKFLPCHTWCRYIEENLELKLSIFVVALIVIIAFFYWNFEYSWSYVLYFGVFLTAILIVIYSVGSKIVYLRYIVPRKAHSDYHIDLGLMMKAHKEENLEEIDRLSNIRQDDNFKLLTENFQLGKTAKNIMTFIENKLKLSDSKVEIQQHIDYDSDHQAVGMEIIIKMLSILLDNALESGTHQPIIVELTVTASYIQLSVRNSFTPFDSEEISRIFTIDGYTTKKINQRGYGLTNIHYDVKKLGGKIMASHEYSHIGKTQYLNITIVI